MSFLKFITGSTRSWQPATTVDTTKAAYWLNWRVLLCSIWVMLSLVFAYVLISKYEYRRDSESTSENQHEECPDVHVVYEDDVWKPCLESVHPGWLLTFRVFAFCVLVLMLTLNVIVYGGSIFYFYTQWTITLNTIYFGLGSILSMHGCYRFKNKSVGSEHLDSGRGSYVSSEGVELNQEHAGFWAYVFQIVFQMSAGAVVMTDTVFWFVIVPFLAIKDYNWNILIVSMHSINAVFLLGETALNSLRFPWFRIGHFFLWTAVYVIFQWIVHACVSFWWAYLFLDLSSSFAPLWYLSVTLIHIPCYGIFLLITKGKHSLLSKWFPQTYIYSNRRRIVSVN